MNLISKENVKKVLIGAMAAVAIFIFSACEKSESTASPSASPSATTKPVTPKPSPSASPIVLPSIPYYYQTYDQFSASSVPSDLFSSMSGYYPSSNEGFKYVDMAATKQLNIMVERGVPQVIKDALVQNAAYLNEVLKKINPDFKVIITYDAAMNDWANAFWHDTVYVRNLTPEIKKAYFNSMIESESYFGIALFSNLKRPQIYIDLEAADQYVVTGLDGTKHHYLLSGITLHEITHTFKIGHTSEKGDVMLGSGAGEFMKLKDYARYSDKEIRCLIQKWSKDRSFSGMFKAYKSINDAENTKIITNFNNKIITDYGSIDSGISSLFSDKKTYANIDSNQVVSMTCQKDGRTYNITLNAEKIGYYTIEYKESDRKSTVERKSFGKFFIINKTVGSKTYQFIYLDKCQFYHGCGRHNVVSNIVMVSEAIGDKITWKITDSSLSSLGLQYTDNTENYIEELVENGKFDNSNIKAKVMVSASAAEEKEVKLLVSDNYVYKFKDDKCDVMVL